MVTSNTNEISSKIVNSKTVKINNATYLNSHTKDVERLAVNIKTLQKIAADYDITKESVYSKNKEITYDVVFEADDNYIKAVYDHSGIILSSKEYYEDVRIPYVLSSQLAKEYPGWSFDQSNCTISYSKAGEAKFTYSVKLKKGNKSKIVTR